MHNLEMPFVFPGCGIYRDHRVSEEIGPGPVSPVVIGRWCAERHINDSAILIRSHVPSPDISSGAVFPSAIQPCLMAGLTRTGNRLKLPQFRAGPRIVGASIPRGAVFFLSCTRSDHHNIPEDRWNSVVWNHHVEDALVAKARIELTRTGIQRDQAASCCKQNARRIPAVSRPPGDTSRGGLATLHVISPDFFPGLWFKRHDSGLR